MQSNLHPYVALETLASRSTNRGAVLPSIWKATRINRSYNYIQQQDTVGIRGCDFFLKSLIPFATGPTRYSGIYTLLGNGEFTV